VVSAVTARTSKETLGFVTANIPNVAEHEVACDVASDAQPASPAKSAAVELQIAAGEAFMAQYKQTFDALAK
jgi:hypothetical protein